MKAKPVKSMQSSVITQANIVQNQMDGDGKPGLFKWKGVETFQIQDGILLGYDRKRRCILVAPLTSVSLATIEET